MVKIENLYKNFGENNVLNGLDFNLPKGKTLSIIGRSGTGKSVLLKIISGLMPFKKGKLFIAGEDVYLLNYEKRFDLFSRAGMVFQHGALFDSLNIFQNVGFYLLENNPKMKIKYVKEIVKRNLKLVDLEDIENLMPSDLSGGMRKRVAIARTLTQNPDILLYDEPTTGLDPVTSDIISNLILKLKNKLNTTSIVVTHDMNCAYKVSDLIGFLHEGKLIEINTPENIRNTRNEFVKQFIDGRAEGPLTAS